MSYELVFPKRVVFGVGKRRDIGALSRPLGLRAVIVCGSRTLEQNGLLREIIANLEESGISILSTQTITHEPEVSDADDLVDRLRSSFMPGDFVIGFGGGSAIDLAKTVAALLPQKPNSNKTFSVKDYLEGVGSGLTLKQLPLPIVAVPTTAGTGAEATKNAVIASYDPPFKKSLRDNALMPSLVVADPELTMFCPPKITAAAGMDAVTQLLESYVSKKHQPVTDALVEQALPAAVKALTVLGKTALIDWGEKEILAERSAIMHAALLSGIALANAGLGMAHGIAPALGTHCRIPHGTACSLLLPITLRTNADVCLDRYAKLGRLVIGSTNSSGNRVSDEAAAEQLISKIEEVCEILMMPKTLTEAGVSADLIPALAADSQGASMSGNPKTLTASDIENILRKLV
ncbi:MAG: iron-containing alcohol dehydrogenase [Planctomycetaceae bacterium]|jgi:alcohol dehydrogenase class IV|nr:iron-containing alcohol dehydrogenase [Planctomycetaceae bacterium]